MWATCVMNRKQKGSAVFFSRKWIFKVMLSTVQVLYIQCWQKKAYVLFCVHIQFSGYFKDIGMHAWFYIYQQKNKEKYLLCLEMDGRSTWPLPWIAIASHKLYASEYATIVSMYTTNNTIFHGERFSAKLTNSQRKMFNFPRWWTRCWHNRVIGTRFPWTKGMPITSIY